MESRLNHLEFLVSHQQEMLETLNRAIVDQSLQIIKLERNVARLENQLREAANGDRDRRDPREEIPPHY